MVPQSRGHLQLLSYIDADDTYRRQTSRQLTVNEGRNQLARRIYHGSRGELRQRYREGQEDQLGALGLVLVERRGAGEGIGELYRPEHGAEPLRPVSKTGK